MPESSRAPTVRLTSFGLDGTVAFVAEVGADDEPAFFIGNPDAGPAVAITSAAADVWSAGNIVAALRVTDGEGRLELVENAGRSRPRRSQR